MVQEMGPYEITLMIYMENAEGDYFEAEMIKVSIESKDDHWAEIYGDMLVDHYKKRGYNDIYRIVKAVRS
jgi:hypothetical protein